MVLVNQIKEIFKQEPSNLDEIKKLLSLREFTKDELAELAVAFTDECFSEYYDALEPEVESVTIENMHSNYVVKAIRNLPVGMTYDNSSVFKIHEAKGAFNNEIEEESDLLIINYRANMVRMTGLDLRLLSPCESKL